MKVAIVAFCFFLTAAAAHADNFRCPNGNIVSTGDSLSTVAIKCDAPTFVTRSEEPVSHRGTSVHAQDEEWTYNEGAHRFIHTLVFHNGTLIQVRSEGFGR